MVFILKVLTLIVYQLYKMLNIYCASAGSGKTFQLTKDYISLLFDAHLNGKNLRPHRRILAVTFTNKATDEMKSRIMKELHLLATGADSPYRADLMEAHSKTANEVNSTAKTILNGILHDYSFFSISTIDKFFLQIIRSFAREIGVSGGYNVELDNKMTLQQALDNMYASLSAEENKNLLSWMTGFLQEQIESGSSRYVDRVILSFGEELFKENYQHKAKEVKELLENKDFLNAYKAKLRKIERDFDSKIKQEVENIYRNLRENGLTGSEFKRNYLLGSLKKLGTDKDYDLAKSFRTYSESLENCITNPQKNPNTPQITNAYNSGIQDSMKNIIHFIDNEMEEYNSAQLILRNIDTLGILADLAEHIQLITNEKNVMLLSDSNMLLNQIIDGSDTPFVYERTGLNIDHYMIDEFQDTSALQWENFKPLIANSLANGDKTNMLVGDVKQSIYRWRNSDWKLLAEQAEKDFKSQKVEKYTLDTNWRSDRNIIAFNNNLFETGADLLQTKFNTELEGSNLANQQDNKIKTAYDDVKQKPSKNAGEGYVRVEFVQKEGSKAEWQEEILSRIPNLVESLVENGYKNSDIAFLVRTNSEAKLITEFMLNYASSPDRKEGFSYLVVGNEGLMLSASVSINFIISVLSYILDPKDDVARTNILYEYQLAKNKREGKSNTVLFDKKVDFSLFFSTKENACLEEIIHLSLYEAVEKLISAFEIESWYGETIFLQAFQDVVFKYSNNNNADLNSFIKWWKEEGNEQRINIPENEHAFRVMTVHASKGLDFKVVIMPFCNWGLKSSAQRAPLLWCETDVAPFSELPLLPVKFGSNLANSIFSEDYFDELLHQYVDNLNIGYVGFTRAENEMYLFSEGPAKNANNLNYFSDLMYKSFSENPTLIKFWNEKEGILEIGKPTKAVYKEEKSTEISTKQTAYPIEDSSNRLRIKHTSKDYWKSKPISESKVNYGTLMHEILQKTIRRGDEEKAIAELISAGKISKEDLPEIQSEFKLFWSNEEAANWFTDGKEVLNENPILLPNGDMYRPDRVLLEGKKAIVIDYKFGEEEKTFYNKQMQNYTHFLKEMGYEDVEGKIYYVRLGKVVSI